MAELSDKAVDDLLAAAPPPEGVDWDDQLVADWVAGRLDEASATVVEGWLAASPEARAFADALRDGVVEEAAFEAADAAFANALAPGRSRAWWGGGLALAAALLLAVFLRPAPPVELRLDGPFGGVKVLRDDPGAPTRRFQPGNRLRLDLLPATPLDAPPPLAAYVGGEKEALRRVPQRFLKSGDGGAWSLQGPAEEILGRKGAARLYLVLEERAGELAGKTPGQARAALPDARWFMTEVELDDP